MRPQLKGGTLGGRNVRIIEFDGLGRPKAAGVVTGTVLLLLQANDVSIVQVELLPPDQFGPSLTHAENSDELAPAARDAIREAFPQGLPTDRHRLLECPTELRERATFRR
jgi:hypothetical protein